LIIHFSTQFVLTMVTFASFAKARYEIILGAPHSVPVIISHAFIIRNVRSKIETLTPVASQVNVHHLRARAGLVGQVSV